MLISMGETSLTHFSLVFLTGVQEIGTFISYDMVVVMVVVLVGRLKPYAAVPAQ